jgi:DNA invertase Pin-like site-specific DNA recombinase
LEWEGKFFYPRIEDHPLILYPVDLDPLDETLKAITQRKADRVMVWSVDRLGRSLQDLISTLNDIKGTAADLYIHQQAIDTSTPAGKALFGMLGIFAEFEKEIISERVVSGLDRAKANGVRLGRKPVAPITVKKVKEFGITCEYKGMPVCLKGMIGASA